MAAGNANIQDLLKPVTLYKQEDKQVINSPPPPEPIRSETPPKPVKEFSIFDLPSALPLKESLQPAEVEVLDSPFEPAPVGEI